MPNAPISEHLPPQAPGHAGDPPPVPYAVKPTKVVWMIQHAPPPTPRCFDSHGQWQEYLMYLHASGETITRRQDTGKWTTVEGTKVRTVRTVVTVFDRIDYCIDCEIGGEYQRQMTQQRRCIVPERAPASGPRYTTSTRRYSLEEAG